MTHHPLELIAGADGCVAHRVGRAGRPDTLDTLSLGTGVDCPGSLVQVVVVSDRLAAEGAKGAEAEDEERNGRAALAHDRPTAGTASVRRRSPSRPARRAGRIRRVAGTYRGGRGEGLARLLAIPGFGSRDAIGGTEALWGRSLGPSATSRSDRRKRCAWETCWADDEAGAGREVVSGRLQRLRTMGVSAAPAPWTEKSDGIERNVLLHLLGVLCRPWLRTYHRHTLANQEWEARRGGERRLSSVFADCGGGGGGRGERK